METPDIKDRAVVYHRSRAWTDVGSRGYELLIEDGKLTRPIKDVNIIGNGPESLRRITMVANDARLDTGGWTCGKNGQSVPVSQGIPTVLVSKMTVGGENVG